MSDDKRPTCRVEVRVTDNETGAGESWVFPVVVTPRMDVLVLEDPPFYGGTADAPPIVARAVKATMTLVALAADPSAQFYRFDRDSGATQVEHHSAHTTNPLDVFDGGPN